jgi:hypothetical protein
MRWSLIRYCLQASCLCPILPEATNTVGVAVLSEPRGTSDEDPIGPSNEEEKGARCTN